VEIRGNVPTRLAKVAAGSEFDATILARAGLQRLGFDLSGSTLEVPGGHTVGLAILDPTVFLPAARSGGDRYRDPLRRTGTRGTVFRIDHLPTWNRIRAERAWLGVLGAGCRTPVGVFPESFDEDRRLRVTTIVFDEATGAHAPRPQKGTPMTRRPSPWN